jgi:hypothetical protein
MFFATCLSKAMVKSVQSGADEASSDSAVLPSFDINFKVLLEVTVYVSEVAYNSLYMPFIHRANARVSYLAILVWQSQQQRLIWPVSKR